MVRTQVPDTPTRRALGSVAAVPYGAPGLSIHGPDSPESPP